MLYACSSRRRILLQANEYFTFQPSFSFNRGNGFWCFKSVISIQLTWEIAYSFIFFSRLRIFLTIEKYDLIEWNNRKDVAGLNCVTLEYIVLWNACTLPSKWHYTFAELTHICETKFTSDHNIWLSLYVLITPQYLNCKFHLKLWQNKTPKITLRTCVNSL